MPPPPPSVPNEGVPWPHGAPAAPTLAELLARPFRERRSRLAAEPIAFTGRGGEYFRIWAVNTLLSLLTLGVYSPWAKVRKARYFRQNTRLAGHVFDYHGRPAAILRGRILALVLFAAYSWSFEFSRTAGLATIGLLCATGPWLFMTAQRFALANTSYRGLRFGFEGGAPRAYLFVLPALVVWFAPTVAGQLASRDAAFAFPFLMILGAAGLAMPWMHHRLKAYQRRHARYGDRRFEFGSALFRFYGIYAGGFLLAVATGLALGPLSGSGLGRHLPDAPWLFGLLSALLAYLIFWPYAATRVQQAVWDETRLGDVRFDTEIRASRLFGLAWKNVLLTVLTLGLYWPWAAIALARYRVECLRVRSPQPLASLASGVSARPGSALGEGASDAFGIDIGL